MRNKDDLKELMDYFHKTEGKSFRCDEEAIMSAFQKGNGNQSLSIKILSVFGGIMASLAFLGFIIIAGLYNSDVALLALGAIFIAGSIWVNKQFDRIILDTVSVSSFIIGFVLFGFGLEKVGMDENIVPVLFILIAIGSLYIVQNYILAFVSVLIINGSLLALVIMNRAYDLIHLFVYALALTITYLFLKEAAIITVNKTLSRLYNPVRTALVVSFLFGLVFLGKKGILPVSPDYIWLSSVIIFSVIVYLLSKLLAVLNITETRHKIGIYILCVLALLPTALSPAISGAILIMLLSFLMNYKTSLVLGIIAFILYVTLYYYDLNYTLLTKSALLFTSGVLFIAFYLFTNKKSMEHEKV